MERTLRAAGLALALAAGLDAAASAQVPSGRTLRDTVLSIAARQRLVDSLFADYARPGAPGASLVVVAQGRVVLRRSFGLADLDPPTVATGSADYRLASLTKQFTATAVMLLADAHRLAFDDSVSRYLPELPAHARGITIRQLLNHTSGIWDYEDFVPDTQTYQVKDHDVLRLIGQADSLYFPSGTAFRYSNTGYALLALVVERVSGRPFARFLRDHVFRPLGMSGSVAYEAGASRVPHRAYGYSRDSTGWVRTDQSNTSAVLGDGGVYTSVDDLVRWDHALETHALVRAATQAEAWTPATLADGRPTEYGFGWFVGRDAHGRRQWHTGETRGFRNAIVRYPDQRVTVIVLTNRNEGEPIELAQRVAEVYLP
jgi:CubicO group peptidase (beta-lactamase class C family)